MSFSDDTAFVPSLPRFRSAALMLSGMAGSILSGALAVEQALVSGPVVSWLEVAFVAALSLIALVSLALALAGAAALDNRGESR